MIRRKIYAKTKIVHTETVEGERIEEKIARITESSEPIGDGAPLIYTKRSDGVVPAYNIRTDRWDLALSAMMGVSQAKDKMAAQYTALKEGNANEIAKNKIGSSSETQPTATGGDA